MPTPKPKAMTIGSIRAHAARTRSCRCPPSGRRGRCRGSCTARSRSTRSRGRAAGGTAARARGCASTGRARSSARAASTSRSPRARASVSTHSVARARRALLAAQAGDPRVGARERAVQRGDLLRPAAVLGPRPRRRPERLLDVDRTPKRSSNARHVASVSANSTPVSIVTTRTCGAIASSSSRMTDSSF